MRMFIGRYACFSVGLCLGISSVRLVIFPYFGIAAMANFHICILMLFPHLFTIFSCLISSGSK
jgi:hypothetical protein